MADILNAIVLFANFVLVPATVYGAQLALGALGVTLIFGILRFANFAHGELMAFGAMITILVTWFLQGIGVSLGPLPTALLALPFGILGAVAMALVTDRMVYRFYRVKRSDPIIMAIVSVGVMFVMAGLVRFIIGPAEPIHNTPWLPHEMITRETPLFTFCFWISPGPIKLAQLT